MRKPKTKDYISKLYYALEKNNSNVESEIQKYFSENIDYTQYNIKEQFVTSREKEEQELIEKKSPYAIRFFKPYVNDNAMNIANGKIPKFLKQNIKSYKEKVESYDDLSPKEQLKLEANLYKELTIACARYVNILNRRKYSDKRDMKTTYHTKHVYIAKFIRFAMIYNKMVSPNQRFEMGILKDIEGKYVLNASIPGFSRLSVHMGGSYNNTRQILEYVEEINKKEIFPRNRGGSIDVEKAISGDNFSYSLPDFGINNTAIINKACTDEAKGYIKHMKEIKNKSDFQSELEMFINLQCSDLNDRELYFLAEKAGYMKGHFQVLTNEIEKRSIHKGNSESLYIQSKLSECEGDKKKQQDELIKLYEKYVKDYISIANINKDINEDINEDIKIYMEGNEKFVEILKKENMLNDSISKEINKKVSEYISPIINNAIEDEDFFESFMLADNSKNKELCCMDLDIFKVICKYGEFEDRFRFFVNYFREMELNEVTEKEENNTKIEEILRSTDDENEINSKLFELVKEFNSEDNSNKEEEFLRGINDLYKTHQSMESKVNRPSDLENALFELGISKERNRQILARYR